jgi:FkbM family methyltransferase
MLIEHGVRITAIVDNDPRKQGTKLFDIPVISPAELNGYDGGAIYICGNWQISADIYSEAFGIGMDRRFYLYNIYDLCGAQYFSHEFISYGDNEVYIDAGAADGGTVRRFYDYCKKFGKEPLKIYGIEAAAALYQQSVKNTDGMDCVRMLHCAAGKEESETECFINDIGMVDAVSGIEKIMLKTRTIDEICKRDKVTFIKMDIEGFEFDALIGAAETIKRDKPKLAVSIYHKFRDIVDLPDFILSLNPDYKFYMRHESPHHPETILYAIN